MIRKMAFLREGREKKLGVYQKNIYLISKCRAFFFFFIFIGGFACF